MTGRRLSLDSKQPSKPGRVRSCRYSATPHAHVGDCCEPGYEAGYAEPVPCEQFVGFPEQVCGRCGFGAWQHKTAPASTPSAGCI